MNLTRETIEAACEAFYNDPSGLTSWERLSWVSPDTANRYRAAMTRAFEDACRVISDEVVEAAAKVHFERSGSYWEDVDPDAKREALDDMRAALRAAAPCRHQS